MMNWAFVDYENVGSLEELNFSNYERVFIFCGPKNTRIKVGELPTTGFCHIELIRVATTGANNLDFHLAFHLGRFHEVTKKEVDFHIISNDNGFNGLVNHLKALGRRCKKVTTKSIIPKKTSSPSLSKAASLVVSRLKQLDEPKRPQKKASFMNWIKSQCQGIANSVQPEAVCTELVNAAFIQESEGDITYQIKR